MERRLIRCSISLPETSATDVRVMAFDVDERELILGAIREALRHETMFFAWIEEPVAKALEQLAIRFEDGS